MTENNNFAQDCNDCENYGYDYSLLDSRYEADIERNEIINWNKYSCNVELRGLEKIAEELNFKEMQLEHCRKGYEELMEENRQLKKELFESEKDYLTETYSDNPVRVEDKIESLKKEFKERFGDEYKYYDMKTEMERECD